MNPIDTVLSKLPDAKQRTGYWQACCPAHDDKTPSLSISVAKNGKVLLRCHAGCEFTDVVQALGLKVKDLFPQNGTGPARTSRIVATYDYTDENGLLLYQTVRKEPKGFYQRQPDGNGGWINSITKPPVTRVLYHLPEVLGADLDDWVFICEGEKSADAVRGLGLVATTNALGAGKWHDDYNPPLAGRKAAVLPDCDPQGENHALKVVSSLKGVAAARRIVKLPSVTDKSDPADWVRAGGTRKELLALLNATKNVESTPLFWDSTDKPKTADYIAALESLGYTFKMNQCNDQVEVNGKPISDSLGAKIRTQMRDLGYWRVNVMEDAMIANAYDNRYHPVQDYLEALQWDGQDHIGELMHYIIDFHCFLPSFFKRWAIGAVARAYQMTQNRVLILDGEQGLGKSHFVYWLTTGFDRPEMFVQGPIDPDDKDNDVRLITAWLWEVSELGSTMRRSDREALKHFLSREQVTVRKPYGRNDLVKPALSSFIGTVNNEAGVLDDPTGHRRFMCVNVTSMDWSYSQVLSPNQIWAQAKALYDQREPWHLTADEAHMAMDANQEYEVEDPLEDLIGVLFDITGDPTHFITTTDILDVLNARGWRLSSPKYESMTLSAVLKKLKVWKDNNARPRGYRGIRRKTVEVA